MNKKLFANSEDICKVVLDNGATLISQVVPGALSVSAGVWIKSGSRDETAHEHGITHFLEHMVFKGTKERSALEIALAMDRIGGQIDAFTSKELTCFSTRVLADYFDISLDVLSDLISRPTLDETLIATEKKVVLEEIRNVYDEPDDLIFEMAATEIFGEHPLARPILGTETSVNAFSRDDCLSWLERKYNAANIVIAIAGPLTHDDLRTRVEARFPIRDGVEQKRNGSSGPPAVKRMRAETKDLNQQHIWIGRRGLGSRDADRYTLLLLSTMLGGSMSSRLFQAIREQAGLAYSVFSFTDFASDTGLIGTYMAVSPTNAGEAIRRTLDEFARVIGEGCTPQELEDTKMQLKGNMLLAMESISARAYRLAKMEINERRFIGVQELVDRIDSVGVEDILRIAGTYLDPDTQTLISLGPSPETGPF
ncbi:MAG: insulinase family protein [bacterium]|nr:insulinase family protein [bacterium]